MCRRIVGKRRREAALRFGVPETDGADEVDAELGASMNPVVRVRDYWARRRSQDKLPIGQAVRRAMMRNPEQTSPEDDMSVEELEELERHANDKERLIGLFAAPWAGGLGLVISNALIANDPVQYLKTGAKNPLHVSIGLYHEVLVALLALAALMLGFAWFRKRLYLGIVMALYGITVFNLKYWGFGIPFALAGAWYLVRASRVHRRLKEARGDAPRYGSRRGSSLSTPRASKRYTPPVGRTR